MNASAKLAEWYRRIESGIRPHVRFLRDNGFNTFSSCESRMEVRLDMLSREEDLVRLDRVLAQSEFEDYAILVRLARRRGVPGFAFEAVVQFGNDRTRHRIARRLRSLASSWWEAPPRRGQQ